MDVTWGHFHAVLLKNCHKYMKAPVTTHDLLLLAESKLSCTNVRNSDKRTQTIGICCCYYHEDKPRGTSLNPLGAYPSSSVLQTNPAYLFTTLMERGGGKGGGKGKKKRNKDETSMPLNRTTATLDDSACQRVF